MNLKWTHVTKAALTEAKNPVTAMLKVVAVLKRQ